MNRPGPDRALTWLDGEILDELVNTAWAERASPGQFYSSPEANFACEALSHQDWVSHTEYDSSFEDAELRMRGRYAWGAHRNRVPWLTAQNDAALNELVEFAQPWHVKTGLRRLVFTFATDMNVSVRLYNCNALDNVLQGNSAANTLTGGAGNDTLDGGTGADTLIGGTGDDTYVVDTAGDVVTELAGEGNDTVLASISFDLSARPNVENVVLTGTGNLNATGNAGDNRLAGNAGNNILTGGAGSDVLDGGAGADTLVGGDGSDTYYVDNAGDVVTETNATASTGGTDLVYATVSYTLGANVENLTLTGFSAINGTGNTLNNVITAGAGDNVLDGGAGTDTVSYATAFAGVTVSLATTSAQATGGSGSDTLLNFQNLTGSAYDDTLTGNTAANVLDGGLGNDTLDGGGGTATS